MRTQTGLFYPLDLAWTRLAADTAARNEPRRYASLLHCISQTYRYEGLRGATPEQAHALGVTPKWAHAPMLAHPTLCCAACLAHILHKGPARCKLRWSYSLVRQLVWATRHPGHATYWRVFKADMHTEPMMNNALLNKA